MNNANLSQKSITPQNLQRNTLGDDQSLLNLIKDISKQYSDFFKVIPPQDCAGLLLNEYKRRLQSAQLSERAINIATPKLMKGNAGRYNTNEEKVRYGQNPFTYKK